MRFPARLVVRISVMNFKVSWKSWFATNRVLVALLFGGVLLPLVVFGAIAEDVWGREILRPDNPILLWAHGHANAQRNSLMLAITNIGSPPLMLAMCGAVAGFLLLKKRRVDLLFFLVSTVGAGLLNLAAKRVFGRARPDLWLSIDPRSDFSFPSGHAMGTMALFAAVLVLLWPTRWRVPFLAMGAIVVFAVGLSRVYLGVHFPSDVLGGWLASLAWVVGLALIRRAHCNRTSSTR